MEQQRIDEIAEAIMEAVDNHEIQENLTAREAHDVYRALISRCEMMANALWYEAFVTE